MKSIYSSLSLILLLACQKEIKPALQFDLSQALCLTAPEGNSPVDHELRARQSRAQRMPKAAESWLAVGQQWVRKARQNDPKYYLQVHHCADAALQFAQGTYAAKAWTLEALASMNAHAFQTAETYLTQALDEDPDDPVAWGLLSDARLELGRFEDAVEAANQSMDRLPNAAAYGRASHLFWLQGDIEAARKTIRKALSISKDRRDPEPTAWLFVQAADMFWHQGDYEGADLVYKEALKWLPNYSLALVGRGRALMGQGQPEAAAQILAQAYAQRPDAKTAWLLGDAYMMAEKPQAANYAYDCIDHFETTDPLTVAQYYAAKGHNLEQALRLIEAERHQRGSRAVMDTHAWILHRLGRTNEALSIINQMAHIAPLEARFAYHAGVIRYESGQVEAGLQLIQKALTHNPSFDPTESRAATLFLKSS